MQTPSPTLVSKLKAFITRTALPSSITACLLAFLACTTGPAKTNTLPPETKNLPHPSTRNYVIELDGKPYDIDLGQSVDVQAIDGQTFKMTLRKKPFATYSDEYVSFVYRSDLAFPKQDLGDGMQQLLATTPAGTLILVQEYEDIADMNPSGLVDPMLREMTKSEIADGAKLTTQKYSRTAKRGTILRGLKATLKAESDESYWEVVAYGNSSKGVLVVTKIAIDDLPSEKPLLDKFWDSFDIRLSGSTALGEKSPKKDSPRSAAAASFIDLSSFYNVDLDQDFTEKFTNGPVREKIYNLSALPIGVTRLGETKFDIGGAVLLTSSVLRKYNLDYPKQVKGIPLACSSRRLHFLHAAGWPESNGTRIGHYRLHYADGTEEEIPLVYGRNIFNSVVNKYNSNAPVPVVWIGTNSSGIVLRLFHTAWENPHPAIVIESMDFVSEVTKSAPLLIAITAEAHSPAAPESRTIQAKEFPTRAPETKPNLIDLSLFYNATLNEDLMAREKGNNLSSLPKGLQRIAGIDWDVRGLIQVTGTELESFSPDRYPQSVREIPVKMKCTKIHFLHGAGWAGTDEIKVGTYVLHYADGEKLEIPILSGKHLRDWWSGPDDNPLTKEPIVAWTGANAAVAKSGGSIKLYLMTHENPRPDVGIKSIDFVSAMTRCAPFLVAVTVE